MSWIAPDDSFSIIALLMLAVAIGMWGEERGWFRTISGVLVTIMLGVLFTSLRLIPNGSNPDLNVPVYQFAFTYLIPYSIPLLLFNIELRKVFQQSGRLMVLFVIACFGVVLGALVATWVLDLGDDTGKLAAVYTATYTGGSVNFMAVATSFDFLKSELFAVSILVDNAFTILFLLLIFYLPGMKILMPYFVKHTYHDTGESPLLSGQEPANTDPLSLQLAQSWAISGIIVALGSGLAPYLEQALATEIQLDALMITVLILIAANIFPKYLQRLEKVAFQSGMFMLYFFLAVIGATCDVGSLFSSSPQVLLFAMIILSIHLLITVLFGKLLKFSLVDIALASGASVGGVSISASMAAAFGTRQALTPAILIGIMGYVLGTFLGIAVGWFLTVHSVV